MDQGPAGTGFSRGFFGCFGMLAAVVLVLFVAFWAHVIYRFSQGDRGDGIPAASTSPGVTYYSTEAMTGLCEASLKAAAAGYRVQGPLKSPGIPTQGAGNAAGTADCPVRDRRGAVLHISLRMNCADAKNLGCYAVLGMYDDRGNPIRARR